MSFGPSARRLLSWLAPERVKVTTVIVLVVLSVVLNSVGPKTVSYTHLDVYKRQVGRVATGCWSSAVADTEPHMPRLTRMRNGTARRKVRGQTRKTVTVAAMTSRVTSPPSGNCTLRPARQASNLSLIHI